MDTLAICRQERKKREPIPVNDAVRAYRQGKCSIESVRIITSAAAGPLAYSVGSWMEEQSVREQRTSHPSGKAGAPWAVHGARTRVTRQ